ncbi:uncharacterized protein LOC127706174 [Mytilus californianus]|uniref:uncharacterized protein LOC127706174 n=1 Tax=Mytilus californianus TaxID=6549 RepID=UPI0022454BEF|nr:uncharacterized protein LOC127706174 [Mytilus californianus]XP_052066573.1 uncharacterized protein LOC127706174 [Mytilus californianus]
MEDDLSKCISLALYQYMCQNIVGSENYVRTIRMMNTVRDNLIINDECVPITGGSFGEGLDLRGGDIDIVYANKYIEVYEGRKFAFDYRKTYLKMETETTQAGYTMLHCIFTNNNNALQCCEKINGKYYFSNALFKQRFLLDQNMLMVIHGPCLSNEQGDYDFAQALHSKLWISAAKNWITRSKNVWPSYEVKHSIVKHGVLFVPVGYKGSPSEELQWRISFNVGEKLLIYTFTHSQLLCYCLLKILLKDVINEHMDVKYRELLCSYFLKTIMFWVSEEVPPSIWKPRNLLSCFMRCFSRLIYYVEFSVCPHYFIPQNNLFANRIIGHARKVLLERLCSLYKSGWGCFKFSYSLFLPRVRRFYTEPCMKYLERIKLSVSNLIRTDASLIDSFSCSCCLQGAITGMHPLLSYKNPKILYLYRYSMSMLCTQKAQLIPLKCIVGNKYCYMNYKAIQYNLLQNIYHDAVSGWLMLASFFYRTEQYNKAIYIISNCVNVKLYPNSEMIQKYIKLCTVKSFQKRLYPLLKIEICNVVRFKSKSTLIPQELQMEVEDISHCFPSTSYTHFLRFLCHYHMVNLIECNESLRDLQRTITSSDRLDTPTSKALSFICLGIGFQLLGNKDSARKAFNQAFKFESFGVKKIAKNRLLMIQ